MIRNIIGKIKIWHFILFILLIVIALCGVEFMMTCKMLMDFIILILLQKKKVLDLITFEIINQFAATFILFLSLPLILLFKRKYNFLQKKISLPNAFIIGLVYILTLCPLIAPYSPNLQFNLPMAKNLAPLSSRYLIEPMNINKHLDYYEEYTALKNSLNREFVDDHFYLSDQDISYLANNKLKAEKIIFLFGTDEFGRDVFSRLIYATRLSLFIGVCAVFITFIIGLLLGFFSGFFGGTIDIVLNRITETFLSFPTIFFVILFLAMFGNSLWNVVLVLGFAGWMSMFKVIRGEVISLKHKNHIITSRKIGMGLHDILFKEFLPLLFPVIITNLTFQFSNVVIAESSLSFLGLTGNNIYPTWGAMIQEGQYYLRQAWWISFFPSFFLILTLLTFNSFAKRLSSGVQLSKYIHV